MSERPLSSSTSVEPLRIILSHESYDKEEVGQCKGQVYLYPPFHIIVGHFEPLEPLCDTWVM